MRTQCPYYPPPKSSILRTLGCRMGRGTPKAMVMPRSLMAFTPANLTRPMKATRVFAGATSYGPGGDEPFETVEQLAGSIPRALQEPFDRVVPPGVPHVPADELPATPRACPQLSSSTHGMSIAWGCWSCPAGSAPGRNRTCDSRFRKPLLSPLSYEGLLQSSSGNAPGRSTGGVSLPPSCRHHSPSTASMASAATCDMLGMTWL
jgi:hypothetical protein